MIDPTVITAALTTIVIGIGLVFAGGIAYIVYDGLGRRRASRTTRPAPAAAERTAGTDPAARPHRETQPA